MNANKVCGEFPEFCYRAFDYKKYAEDFMNRGVFRMGCQLYFKACESKSRCDPTEGTGSTKEPGFVTSIGFSQNHTKNQSMYKKWAIVSI